MPKRKRKAAAKTTAQWRLPLFTLAAFVYLAFSIYLYNPHYRKFRDLDNLLVVSLTLAALGCYTLSRRWVASFLASFLAGAVYGFGPYLLGLARFHPAAGLLAAAIPWLLCPSAFGFKKRRTCLRYPCVILPFAAIIVFFLLSSHFRLFAVPNRVHMHSRDVVGLLAPLVVAKLGGKALLVGFYHVPVAMAVLGLILSMAARRYALLTIPIAAVILGLSRPILDISPIMWFSIPTVFVSVAFALGLQGVLLAGRRDRKWILFTVLLTAFLSIAALLLATKYFQVFLGFASGYAKLFLQAGKIYLLAAVTMAIIFLLARSELRAKPFRWLLLATITGLDIFLGASYIIDKVL